MKKLLERDLQKTIIDYLRIKKFVVIKYNNVGIKKPNGRYIPVGQLGVADLLIISPAGRFWALECKIKPNKPSKPQEAFLSQIRGNNGIGEVVYSLDEVVGLVKKFKDF